MQHEYQMTLQVQHWNRDDPEEPPQVVWEADVPALDLGDVLVVDGQRYVMDLTYLVAVDDEGNPARRR